MEDMTTDGVVLGEGTEGTVRTVSYRMTDDVWKDTGVTFYGKRADEVAFKATTLLAAQSLGEVQRTRAAHAQTELWNKLLGTWVPVTRDLGLDPSRQLPLCVPDVHVFKQSPEVERQSAKKVQGICDRATFMSRINPLRLSDKAFDGIDIDTENSNFDPKIVPSYFVFSLNDGWIDDDRAVARLHVPEVDEDGPIFNVQKGDKEHPVRLHLSPSGLHALVLNVLAETVANTPDKESLPVRPCMDRIRATLANVSRTDGADMVMRTAGALMANLHISNGSGRDVEFVLANHYQDERVVKINHEHADVVPGLCVAAFDMGKSVPLFSISPEARTNKPEEIDLVMRSNASWIRRREPAFFEGYNDALALVQKWKSMVRNDRGVASLQIMGSMAPIDLDGTLQNMQALRRLDGAVFSLDV